MITINVRVNDEEFEQVSQHARKAGNSVEDWVRDQIRRAALSAQPVDPLFGLLADDPELADAIDEVVAERSRCVMRAS